MGTESYSTVVYTHYRLLPAALAFVLMVIYFISPQFGFLLIACCIPMEIAAESPYSHALHQLQAGDLPQAFREWTVLASTSKTNWDKGVALYNLAYVLIEQKKWQEAINTLDLIPLTSETPPYLTYRVLWNNAWARFQLNDDPKLILEILGGSEKAYCDWLKLIGEEDCTPPASYGLFQKLISSTPYHPPVKQRFIFNPDPVEILKQLISLLEEDNLVEVFIAMKAFETRSLELQKERFLTACQFHLGMKCIHPITKG